MKNTESSGVAPIEDMPFGIEPYSTVVAYVAGSEKGKSSDSGQAHGFGVVIAIDDRIARFGYHASRSDETTFNRGYLGATLTALEWCQRNAVLNQCNIRSNAEYIWRSGSELLAGWVADGRLNATHPKVVENSDLWRRIADLVQNTKDGNIEWQALNGKHDEECFIYARSIARYFSLIAQKKAPDEEADIAVKYLCDAVSQYDEDVQRDHDIARAVERDRS